MDKCFSNSEKLYRAVKPEGIYLKNDGTLSSAAFKSSNGCSVDRGDERSDIEAAKFMLKNLSGDIYKIVVSNCYEKNIYVNYEPIEGINPYHCGLYKDEELDDMTSSQCRFLAKVAVKVS
ncbi:MAG: hypothetical protein J6H31_06630 [Butyrivibrio sp.]|nr:hypothetical protein [Butyrivibrio sp.]